MEDALSKIPAIDTYTNIVGFNMLGGGASTYNDTFFVRLKDWDERKKPEEQAAALSRRLSMQFSRLPQGIAFSITPPAIPGVGSSGGVSFVLEDRAGKDLSFLTDNLQTFMQAARKRPELATLNTTFLPSVPQVFARVDRDKTIAQGVAVGDVYQTLQAFMGGSFINYFSRFGRQWRVFLEAEGEDRTRAENIGQFYVRNNKGDMVPLSALTSMDHHRTGIHTAL
jgi:HAE1 family hydrophobic/amphiphilic exporter-1